MVKNISSEPSVNVFIFLNSFKFFFRISSYARLKKGNSALIHCPRCRTSMSDRPLPDGWGKRESRSRDDDDDEEAEPMQASRKRRRTDASSSISDEIARRVCASSAEPARCAPSPCGPAWRRRLLAELTSS